MTNDDTPTLTPMDTVELPNEISPPKVIVTALDTPAILARSIVTVVAVLDRTVDPVTIPAPDMVMPAVAAVPPDAKLSTLEPAAVIALVAKVAVPNTVPCDTHVVPAADVHNRH